MRIALLTDGIWPFAMGGMQKHSYIFANELAKQGIAVDLYLPAIAELSAEQLLLEFPAEIRELIHPVFIPRPRVSSTVPGAYMRAEYYYSRNVYRVLDKNMEGIQWIYAQGLTAWYLLKKGRKKAPLLLNLHGYEFAQWLPGFSNRLKSTWLHYFFKKLILKADYLVSLGGRITDIIRSFGIEDARIIEHRNGIELKVGSVPLEKGKIRKFIFVGRYERRKGIEELLKAWNQLKPDKAELHFVGPMPERLQWRLPGVFFHGSITNRVELDALYAHATFLVLPSYSEGMPIVILEALVHECICLVSKVGAIEAYINEVNGRLMEAGNMAQLQGLLLWGMNASDAELENKRAQIRKMLPELSWEKSTGSFLTLLRQRGLF